MRPTTLLSTPVAVLCLLMSLPSFSLAQYMFLDANGDGLNTPADHLATTGSTTLDVWLNSNHNKDGTLATCSNGTGSLTVTSYEFCLLVSNGTAIWGTYSNNQSFMTTGFGVASSATAYRIGFGGQTNLSPGTYKLGTLILTAFTGAPSILIVPASSLSETYFTAFGSSCLGRDFDNYPKLGPGPNGPGDWTDADGIDSTPLSSTLAIYPRFFSYDGGADPEAIITADINGDALPDIVVANRADSSLSVFLAQSDGISRTFAPRIDTPLGGSPGGIAAGDINGDGKLDLAVTFPSANLVSTLLGSGTGTFGSRADYPTGVQPEGVALAPVGSGTDVDMVYANYGSSTASYRINNGDGTYGTPNWNYLTAANPKAVFVGNLDGDATPDLATSNYSGSVTVYPDFSVSLRADYSMAAGTNAIGVADLNKDGLPDIFTTGFVGDAYTWRLGTGLGAFGPGGGGQAGNDPTSLSVGDVDGDGFPDLTVISSGEGLVSVILASGPTSFTTRTTFSAANQPFAHVVGDLDGNGTLDMAVTNSNSNTISVHPGNGDGTFGSRLSVVTSPGAGSITARDLDVDGILDAVVPMFSYNYVSTFLGNHHGFLKTEATYFAGGAPRAVAVDDFNADGKPDFASANAGSGSVTIQLNRGDGTFGPNGTDYGVGVQPKSIVSKDFNNDGKFDLAIANASSNTVSVLIGNGDGTFGGRVDYSTGSHPDGVAAGDLNGDTRPDLVVVNRDANTASVLLANTGGGFGAKTDFATAATPFGVALGDWNANGALDVVAACQSGGATGNGTVSVLLGNGAGSLAAKTDFGSGAGLQSVTVGDANSDGILDLVTAASHSNCVSVLLGIGNGSFRPKMDLGVGFLPAGAVLGDFNDDGQLDIAAANSGGPLGTISILLNRLAVTGIATANSARSPVSLRQNYPNPFNPYTTISYDLSSLNHVLLAIFDVHGRVVRKLIDAVQPAGRHALIWDGADGGGRPLASGVYFFRLQSAGQLESRRMVLLR